MYDDMEETTEHELHAEVAAIRLTGRLGAFGSAFNKYRTLQGPAIVIARPRGIPFDRHTLHKKGSQAHLEKLVPSAVKVALEEAVRYGWLLKYVLKL